MDTEVEFKLPDWIKYNPHKLDYYSNADRQDLLCRFKLTQVYQNFCVARMNCIFSDENTNYGDLDPEGKNKEWIKKLFLQNALLYYNICVDLSWCMAYFYCIPKQEGNFNITNEEIEAIEKEINYDSLHEFLNMQLNIADKKEKVILEELKKLITEFWNEKIPEGFRQDYNFIKHRGTFDIFDSIAKNENVALFVVESSEPDITIPKFKEFDSEKYINILRNFHTVFLEYIDNMIDIIINPKYSLPKYNFEEIINNVVNNSTIELK